MKHIKPFRNDLYHDIENPLIDYVRTNYELDSIYDLRQRGDDKWGFDLIRTNKDGNEEVIWRGWYPEDILNKPNQIGDDMFPGVRTDKDIQLRRMSYSINKETRIDCIYIVCPTKCKYTGESVRWEVFIGYRFKDDINHWKISELNNKRIEEFSNSMNELEKLLKVK